MGKGGDSNENSRLQEYSWAEVQTHCSKDDKWIVINGSVYDISRFQRRHPGGARVISHFSGQDATDVFTAMHNDKVKVARYMKPLLVGTLRDEAADPAKNAINEDFRELRRTAEKMDLFKTQPGFFALHFGHLILLEIAAYLVFVYFGTSWLPYLSVVLLLTTSQAQAGWTQHDYGHLSVLPTLRGNHFMHQIVIGALKGASSHWWTFRHNQHHAKPNIHLKDPDITVPYVFLLGDRLPRIWGRQHRGVMNYSWQHRYFWILGPPILLPVYFHLENLYFVFKRREWLDLSFMLLYFYRLGYVYGPFLGGWGTFGLYMTVRFFESFWFTFVTQMNHIPMEIDKDLNRDWLTSQTVSTCNVDPSWFNDWFTGHLNFQIEHHLFPTMPRHNYIKIRPYVQSLCKKHGLNYVSKPLGTAFADILRSLKKSGEIWYEAYHHT